MTREQLRVWAYERAQVAGLDSNQADAVARRAAARVPDRRLQYLLIPNELVRSIIDDEIQRGL
jgi:hypothetical protein